jgi:hypothetical protein
MGECLLLLSQSKASSGNKLTRCKISFGPAFLAAFVMSLLGLMLVEVRPD